MAYSLQFHPFHYLHHIHRLRTSDPGSGIRAGGAGTGHHQRPAALC